MKLDPIVRERYPDFAAGYVLVSGVTIETTVEGLVERKREVFSELKAKYAGVQVTEIPEIRAYRSFFKIMGADPSSYRPAPEYLLRRVLDDRFPAINNLVDSCLLASVEHFISGGVYDKQKLVGDARTTLAAEGEKPFELIDGRKLIPKPNEVILRDDQKILSAYTLGDSKLAKVAHETSTALVVLWNAPGISKENMEAAVKTIGTYARKYCGGHIEKSEIL
jgi:DNA/RNA-binding domain of Phe-tRNA-synthetase-like protein